MRRYSLEERIQSLLITDSERVNLIRMEYLITELQTNVAFGKTDKILKLEIVKQQTGQNFLLPGFLLGIFLREILNPP